MSSIGNVSSLNFNPFRLLALLDSQSASTANSSGAAQSTSGSNTTATTAAATTAAATSTTGSTSTAAAGSTSLWDQLTAAFNSALQNAEQTGNTSNLASVLQKAGNQVLQNNGINPATFAQQLSGQTQGMHHHHHHHGGSGGAGQTTSGTTGTSGDASTTGGTTGTTGTTATSETSNQQLSDLLAQIFGTSSGNLFNQQA